MATVSFRSGLSGSEYFLISSALLEISVTFLSKSGSSSGLTRSFSDRLSARFSSRAFCSFFDRENALVTVAGPPIVAPRAAASIISLTPSSEKTSWPLPQRSIPVCTPSWAPSPAPATTPPPTPRIALPLRPSIPLAPIFLARLPFKAFRPRSVSAYSTAPAKPVAASPWPTSPRVRARPSSTDCLALSPRISPPSRPKDIPPIPAFSPTALATVDAACFLKASCPARSAISFAVAFTPSFKKDFSASLKASFSTTPLSTLVMAFLPASRTPPATTPPGTRMEPSWERVYPVPCPTKLRRAP